MKIKNGEFWQGDCLELMKNIPDGSVDLIVVDEPYETLDVSPKPHVIKHIREHGVASALATFDKDEYDPEKHWDCLIPPKKKWEEIWRVCKPNAAVVSFCQLPFLIDLGVNQLEYLRYEWIWKKTKATGHLNAKKMPTKIHENILVFYKKLPTYNPQGLIRLGTPKLRKGGDNGDNYQNSDKDSIQEFSNYPNDILEFPSATNTVHSTQKPVELIEYLIKTYSNEGETVLDFTAGSGTTAIAAENTGRKWICIELTDRYYKIATDRVKNHSVTVLEDDLFA